MGTIPSYNFVLNIIKKEPFGGLFKCICEKYNGIYRTPLPEITLHVCRHTDCSNRRTMLVVPFYILNKLSALAYLPPIVL